MAPGSAGTCGGRAGACASPASSAWVRHQAQGGVCLFAVIVAGCGAGCQRIHIACGCQGCGAAHHLLNVPRLMQGSARQRVEQRHQQKHDVERQGGDGAAQHDGMRIILNCERRIAALCARKKRSDTKSQHFTELLFGPLKRDRLCGIFILEFPQPSVL